MNKILAAVILGLTILICFLKMENFKLEKKVLECESKSDKKQIQILDSETQNNQQIIKQTNEVIKRERKNTIIPISDDLKWLSENYNSDKN